MSNYHRFGVDDRVARRDEFREILKEERRAERREGSPVFSSVRRGPEIEPEFASIRAFVGYMRDEADDDGKIPPFTVEQAEKLSNNLRMGLSDVILALKSAGLVPAKRDPSKAPRGYRSTENIWQQNPSHATSGREAITGFASGSRSGRAPELGMTRRHASRFPVPPAKPQGLGQVDPEKDRARLQLIKEGDLIRAEREKAQQEKIRQAEQALQALRRREALMLRLLGEVEVIRHSTVSVQLRIDKAVRFLNLVKLYREHHGEHSLADIDAEIAEVKAIFNELVG